MASTDDPGSPPSLRLAMKFLARGNWAALKRECLTAITRRAAPSDYQRWRELHRLTNRDGREIGEKIASWSAPPTISIIGGDKSSVQNQLYPRWECAATLEEAMGEYVCFMNADDELAEHALFRIAEAIVIDPTLDVVYSDEDTISDAGVHSRPFFKPDWSPEYFLAFPYVGRLAVYRRKLVQETGGIYKEFGSAFEYDLMFRLIAAGAKIYHIPDVLYHRGEISTVAGTDVSKRAVQKYLDSTGQNARVEEAGQSHSPKRMQKTLTPTLSRNTGRGGQRENAIAAVEEEAGPAVHRVRFAIRENPMVSIVIPSACRPITFRDRPSWFVFECVSSIRRLSTYKNIEIIVLDNNDMSAALAEALAPFDVRRVPFVEKFNLTRKINQGASEAKGEQLILLNDDIEIITPDWIEAMLEFSQQPDIGAVGVQLLFPDDTQQHTGVVIQDGNPRHPFYHWPGNHPGYFHSSEVHRNWAAVTGACTMTRAELFKAVGGYSERFALSYNDVDYCLKALELGKRVVYTPYAKLYHHESVSRPLTRPDHVTAFKQYWSSRFARDPYYNPNLGRHFRVRPA